MASFTVCQRPAGALFGARRKRPESQSKAARSPFFIPSSTCPARERIAPAPHFTPSHAFPASHLAPCHALPATHLAPPHTLPTTDFNPFQAARAHDPGTNGKQAAIPVAIRSPVVSFSPVRT